MPSKPAGVRDQDPRVLRHARPSASSRQRYFLTLPTCRSTTRATSSAVPSFHSASRSMISRRQRADAAPVGGLLGEFLGRTYVAANRRSVDSRTNQWGPTRSARRRPSWTISLTVARWSSKRAATSGSPRSRSPEEWIRIPLLWWASAREWWIGCRSNTCSPQ